MTDDLDDLLADAATHTTWDLEQASLFIRAAYGKGYLRGLSDPDPDLKAAYLEEREAWAHLPV